MVQRSDSFISMKVSPPPPPHLLEPGQLQERLQTDVVTENPFNVSGLEMRSLHAGWGDNGSVSWAQMKICFQLWCEAEETLPLRGLNLCPEGYLHRVYKASRGIKWNFHIQFKVKYFKKNQQMLQIFHSLWYKVTKSMFLHDNTFYYLIIVLLLLFDLLPLYLDVLHRPVCLLTWAFWHVSYRVLFVWPRTR